MYLPYLILAIKLTRTTYLQ